MGHGRLFRVRVAEQQLGRSRVAPDSVAQVTPSGGALGAEISGIDLTAPLPPAAVDAVRAALREHNVLTFRGREIEDRDQVRFTSYFGKPVEHVRPQPDRPLKEIFVISNVQRDGKPIGALGDAEIPMHSDLAYMPKPGTISVLRALEVPATGGRTTWVSGTAAYETLDQATKERILLLRAVHRHPEEGQNPPESVDHPVVRVHPETGRRSLYVSPHFTRRVLDLSRDDSDALLQRLFDHLARPELAFTHDWAVKDLVIWDNRPTLHYREPFPSSQRRIMKRTQVFGDEVPLGVTD